jgi:hypothetical protein
VPDISALLAGAKPREGEVPLCLAGDLVGEVERLQGELAHVGDGWVSTSMADADPRVELVKQIEAVREEMRAASVTFRLRALGHRAFSNLVAAHPAAQVDGGVAYDAATFLPALVAACCVDPVMTVDQVRQLLDVVNDGQARELFGAALAVNEEASPLPFS